MTSRLDIRALTGLRFVAAVLVLIAHVALAFPTSLLMRLADHPINRVTELLPWNIGLASPIRAAA
jgi:peptidoglycan/LPS O-acetylase OafA/YrhL